MYTHYTFVLFSRVFANQNLRLLTLCLEGFVSFHYANHRPPICPDPGRVTSDHPPKLFRINTYEIPRKCCKQRTYMIAKSFRFRTYKKQGGGGCYG